MGLYDRDYMRQEPAQEAEPGGTPVKPGVRWGVILVGVVLVVAMLMALLVTR